MRHETNVVMRIQISLGILAVLLAISSLFPLNNASVPYRQQVPLIRMKKIKSTNGPMFFKLLHRAARPQSQQAGKTSAPAAPDDCSDRKTRSNTSACAAEKYDGKSHEPNA
jgi:hypothetical protein